MAVKSEPLKLGAKGGMGIAIKADTGDTVTVSINYVRADWIAGISCFIKPSGATVATSVSLENNTDKYPTTIFDSFDDTFSPAAIGGSDTFTDDSGGTIRGIIQHIRFTVTETNSGTPGNVKISLAATGSITFEVNS